MYPQSENELEKELIQQLSSQYKKVKINNREKEYKYSILFNMLRLS